MVEWTRLSAAKPVSGAIGKLGNLKKVGRRSAKESGRRLVSVGAGGVRGQSQLDGWLALGGRCGGSGLKAQGSLVAGLVLGSREEEEESAPTVVGQWGHGGEEEGVEEYKEGWVDEGPAPGEGVQQLDLGSAGARTAPQEGYARGEDQVEPEGGDVVGEAGGEREELPSQVASSSHVAPPSEPDRWIEVEEGEGPQVEWLEGGVLSVNVDGNKDWFQRVVDLSVGCGGPRGIIMVQDTRWTRQQAVRYIKQLREMVSEVNGQQSVWRHAHAPQEDGDGQPLKPMGGCLVGVWGDLTEGVTKDDLADAWGRWCGVKIMARGGRSVTAVSCYRAPYSPKPGSMTGRLVAKGVVDTATELDTVFYTELGDVVKAGLGGGGVTIVAGDFNANPTLDSVNGRKLNSWRVDSNLRLAGGGLSSEPSFKTKGPGTHIDHIFRGGWTSEVERAVTREFTSSGWGHRAILADLGGEVTKVLELHKDARVSYREKIRGMRAAARAERARPLVLDPKQAEAFSKEVGVLESHIDSVCVRLVEMGTWGSHLWEDTQGKVEPEDLADAGDAAQRWLGRKKQEVLDEARQAADEIEAYMVGRLLQAAKKVAPRKGRDPSRRSALGWYPEIGVDRCNIRFLHRALAAVAAMDWARAADWGERAGMHRPAAAGGTGHLECWIGECRRRLKAAQERRQGHRRREWAAKGKGYWRRLKTAALVGDARTMAAAIRGRRTTQSRLSRVKLADGSEARGAAEVVRATNDHFAVAFGRGQAREGPVAELGEDSHRGRALREDVARGIFPEAWRDALPAEDFSRLTQLVRRKKVAGVELQSGWHSDWLAAITVEEWTTYWSNKKLRSSPGASGVGVDMWKFAPAWVHELACATYSACMRLKVHPSSWRQEVVVPIPKVIDSDALGDLRPLKLLEVTKKAVMSVIKGRMQGELEARGILSEVQAGFRPGLNCHLAALRLQTAYEAARRDREELHVVAMDIAKAYDSVERGWGKGVALERLGVDRGVTEWFMAADRLSYNWVRTGWEPLLEEANHPKMTFEAERGFTQGAAESPLLWIIFYDMVLDQLQREGVGQELVLGSDIGSGGGYGVEAFADDTLVAARSRGRCSEVLAITRKVLSMVGLRLAAHKSVHLGVRWLAGSCETGLLHPLAEEDDLGVDDGLVKIPQIDYDVGFRYLGCWIDATGDGGEQQERLVSAIEDFGVALKLANPPAGAALYLYKAVLLPRLLYPLMVASLEREEIDMLEQRAWRRLAPFLGGWWNMDVELRRAAPAMGGLGLTAWSEVVAYRRIQLLRQINEHRAPWVRDLSNELAVGWARDRGGSGRLFIGGPPSVAQQKVEEANEMHSWMRGLDSMLRGVEAQWRPARGSRGWRQGDAELGALKAYLAGDEQKWLTRAGVIWRSDLCDEQGAVVPVEQVPGWHFLKRLSRDLGGKLVGTPLGAWYIAEEDAPHWRPATWALAGDRLGVIRGWRKEESGWLAGMELAPGAWRQERGNWRIWEGTLPFPGPWPTGQVNYLWIPLAEVMRCVALRARPDRWSGKLVVWVWSAPMVPSPPVRGPEPYVPLPYMGKWLSGSPVDLREAVARAAGNGLPVLAVSDGSLAQNVSEDGGISSHSQGGWAIGIGCTQEVDGEGRGEVQWIAEGAQSLPPAVGGVESSFRAEIGGAVMLLRVLVEATEGLTTPVCIIQASDNLGMIRMIQRAQAAQRNALRCKAAIVGAEELGLLRALLRPRVHWVPTWVKAHPEADTDRSEDDWTDLERGNVRADVAAGSDAADFPQLGWNEAAWSSAMGGTWSNAQGDRLELPPGGKGGDERLAMGYVTRRQRRAGGEAASTEAAGLLKWDSRPWARTKDRDWSMVPFRCKLWWGHLLPYLARHETACRHCGVQTQEMQWHLLAECKHGPIAEARAEVQRVVRGLVWETVTELKLDPELMTEVVECLWYDERGWRRAEGQHRVPGLGPAPWLGLFPPQWINAWWDGVTGKDVKAWRVGIKKWTRLGRRLVEGCRTIWLTSVQAWRLAARKEAWQKRQAAGATRKEIVCSPEEAARRLAVELSKYRAVLHFYVVGREGGMSEEEILEWGRRRSARIVQQERSKATAGKGRLGRNGKRKTMSSAQGQRLPLGRLGACRGKGVTTSGQQLSMTSFFRPRPKDGIG